MTVQEREYDNKILAHIDNAKKEGRTERKHVNGIDYLFVTENDGWISIFEYHENRYIPLLQAANIEHAITYITMREPLSVAINKLV